MRVSISRLKTFKSCRREYQLRYKENLVPVQTADALQTGANYHKLIENYYAGEFAEEPTKECAMAKAYIKYIAPKFEMGKTEEWVKFAYPNGNEIIGRVDGIAKDGCVVEHKTTSATNFEEYEYNLAWDEQILAYMLCTGARKIYYTVIKKPTIRLKKDETEEEFYQRMCEWYDDDTDNKVRFIEITRTDAEVEQFKADLEMVMLEVDHCEAVGAYYKNTNYCNHWGRMCEYAPICLKYDPNETYVDFEKREEQVYGTD